MLNQTLNNRYKIMTLLGEGAMGEVYRATDTQTGQVVAVKVITQKLVFDPEILERFRREGEALRRLRHPNIIGFVDMFPFEGHQAIVMEYVPGGNLHALIKRGPLPVARAHQIALDLCDALTRAHRLNIVHRDLKPENVLIAEDGTPKLTDFGVARLLGETAALTTTGAMVGTPYYMSPEAWQGKALDAQTDIWSLGVVLYEMLAGRVPFAGETLPAVMNKVLSEPPVELRTFRSDTPPALAKIVRRMLMRNKAKRYASMREVALDLERVRPGSDLDSEPDITRVGRKWPKRALAVGGAGLLVLLCLLVTGALGFWAAGRFWAAANTPAAPRVSAGATQTVLAKGGAFSPTPAPSLTPKPPTGTPMPTSTDTLVPPTFTPQPPAVTDTLGPPSSTPMPPTVTPTLGVGATLLSDKDGMTLVYVPAGGFLMGAAGTDRNASSSEKPQHTVYLDAYWIDQTDVTNAMYAQCVKAGQCQPPLDTASATHASYYSNVRYEHCPVIQVSWYDATAYCQWAGRRLPTEAEWEKAARGTDGRIYPWGNQAPDATLTNFNQNIGDTTEVGAYPNGASPYGALDMAGNVWQWVNDGYSDGYYSSSPAKNPPGPSSEQFRVRRGGSWLNEAPSVRVTTRHGVVPDDRSVDYGFRCARTP